MAGRTAVGALFASLDLESATFGRDLTRAGQQVTSTSALMNRAFGAVDRGVGSVIRSVGRFATSFIGIGTLIAGGGLVALTRQAIEAASAIKDMADRTGVGVAAIQELGFAASQSDVSAQDLEAGLIRLNRSIGEAGTGTQAQVDAFARLGVAIRDTDGRLRSADQVIGEVADGLGRLGSDAARAQVASDVFGKSFATLTPLLNEGSAGIAAMRAEARRLGLVLEDDLVVQAERAGDELDKVGKIVSVNVNRALIALAPVIIEAAVAFANLAPAIADASRSLAAFFVGPTALGADQLRAKIAGVIDEFNRLQFQKQQGFAVDFFDLRETELKDQLDELNAALLTVEQRERGIRKLFETLGGEGEGTAGGAVEKVAQVTEALQFELDQMGRTELGQRFYNELKRAGVEANTEAAARIYALVAALDAEQRAQDDAAEAEKRRGQEQGKAAPDPGTFDRDAAPEFDADAERAAQAQGGVTRAIMDSTEAAREFGSTASEVFKAAIAGGESLTDTLGRIASRLSDLLADRAFQMLFDPKSGGGFDLLGTIFSGFGSAFGGGGTPAMGGVGSSFSGGAGDFNFAGFFAEGGTIGAGEIGVVGEGGAELVAGPATVVPGLDRIAGGGAVVVNQTLVVQAGVSQTVRAEMAALLPAFKRETMAAVIDGQRRSGGAMLG